MQVFPAEYACFFLAIFHLRHRDVADEPVTVVFQVAFDAIDDIVFARRGQIYRGIVDHDLIGDIFPERDGGKARLRIGLADRQSDGFFSL